MTMRAYRKVSIVSGSQTIPVKVCTMVRKSTGIFHNGCPTCKGIVNKKNVCVTCDKEIQYADLLRVTEIGGENHVFTKEQIEDLKNFDLEIKVLGFIPKERIDIRLISDGYYILPTKLDKKKHTKDSTKPYVCLRDGIEFTNKVLVVEYCISGKQKLGILTIHEGVLILKTWAYYEDFVECDELPRLELTEAEAKAGQNFIECLKEINPAQIENSYTKKIEELLSGKPTEIINAETETKDDLEFFNVPEIKVQKK